MEDFSLLKKTKRGVVKIKRLLISISLLAFCLIFSMIAYFRLCDFSEQYSNKLSICADMIKADKYIEAFDLAKEIEEDFTRHNRFIGAVVGDDIVDTLHYGIPSISHLIDDRNYTRALEIIRECQHTAEEIPKGEKISIDNIF